MKWIVFVVLLVPALASAQTPSKQFDPNKRSSFEGRVFDTKTFSTKTFQTKEVETKPFETKEFATKTSQMGEEHYATKPFAPPTDKKVGWWQKLFGSRQSDMSGKTVDGKNFATSNFAAKAMPTKTDGPLQEQLDHMRSPRSLAMPNIKPTPEEINKPVGMRPKSFPTATPAPQ